MPKTMSKTSIFIIVAAAILVVAAVVCCIFLFNTKDLEPEKLSLVGTWRVYNPSGDMIQEEYYVFSETEVSVYRNGSATPMLTKTYTMDHENSKVCVTDVKDYHIEKKTANVLVFYADAGHVLLVKVADNAFTERPVYTADDIQGTYDVILHGNNPYENEVVKFEGNTMTDERNGQVFVEAPFFMENGVITLTAGGNTMRLLVVFCDATTLRMIDISNMVSTAPEKSCLAWELSLVGTRPAPQQPQPQQSPMVGTWRVYRKSQGIDQLAYYVSVETELSVYQSGATTPAMTLGYTVGTGNVTITGLGEFVMDKKTDNVVLFANGQEEFLLIKAAASHVESRPVYTAADIEGTYNVSLHDNGPKTNEVASFAGGTLTLTVNGQTAQTLPYTVEDGVLVVAGGAMRLVIVSCDQNGMLLVNITAANSYAAWDMTRA